MGCGLFQYQLVPESTLSHARNRVFPVGVQTFPQAASVKRPTLLKAERVSLELPQGHVFAHRIALQLWLRLCPAACSISPRIHLHPAAICSMLPARPTSLAEGSH